MSVQLKTKENILSLLIFLLIFVSNDTLLFGSNSNRTFINIGYGIIATIIILLFIYSLINIKNFNRTIFTIGFIFILTLFINTLFLNDYAGTIITKICLIAIALVITNQFGLDVFLKSFSKVMLILCLISIIPFILGFINVNMFNFLPKVINTSGTQFYSGGIFNVIIKPRSYIRNYGVFREPSIFGMFITIALLYELVKNKTPKLWVVATFVITAFTTFSTLAFVSLNIMFIIFLINGKSKFGKKIYYVVASSGVAIGLIIASFIIFSLVKGEKIISLETRISAIIANMRVFENNIIFGTGITNYEKYFTSCLYGLASDGGNTSTILINFAMHGILFGLLCAISLIGFAFQFSKNHFINILVLLVLIINLLMGCIVLNVVFYIIVIYGLYNLFKIITNKKEYL